MPFNHKSLRVNAFPVDNEGFKIWRYDAGEDLPSAVMKDGYFRSLDLDENDLILVNCDGTRLLLVVVDAPAVKTGLLGRWPDGFKPGRK